MNNENFAGIMGTVKQAEVTNGVCGYDTENLYVVLRVCVPRKSGAEDTVIVAAKIKENENIDAEAIARNMVVGRDIMATGILQKAINAESGHTAVFILAEQVATVAFPEYQNGVQLTAEIVNNPEVRETPRGKHIADVMLKVENCIQGGNVHIPCIFWQENASEIAKKVNYDLSKVGLCNTDCSEFQNVCAVASGAAGVTHGSNGWTTATMRNALKAAGYKIITDSAFLKNENYCVRGAIYVKESSHTVCGLTNGTYAAQTLAKAGIGGYAGNNNYSGKGIGTAVAKCDMNIRSVAEVKSNTVYSSIKVGTKVEVLEVLANGWYKIVWAGASCGYAYTSNTNNKYYTYTANSKNNSTSTSGSSGLKQTQKPESALCFDKTLAGAYVVTADKLHMRAGAGKTKADYGTIAEGGKVHCYGYYNKEKGTGAKWLYVACGNVTGYCHSDYLKRA